MKTLNRWTRRVVLACAPLAMAIGSPTVAQAAAPAAADQTRHARVIEHWTGARRAAAIPRDLRIDPRGLGYLRNPDGSLQPYGHGIAALASNKPTPNARPVPGDTIPPVISAMDPASGATVGGSHVFAATITDASGIKSATFTVQKSGGQAQSFAASAGANDRWSISLTGLTDGDWSWRITAKDNGGKGGNTATSDTVNFTVNTGGGGGGGGGGTVTNAEWAAGGDVQTAAGRIYFEMPNTAQRRRWSGYVCSGTAVTDNTSGRSVILTAAHCVYDDANKAFARNVLFIPNQAGTSGAGTDLNCSNDPLGCWTPAFGVVDTDWANRTFPDNVEWDYAWYVVSDSGAHTAGFTPASDALDAAAGTLTMDFSPPAVNDGNPGEGTPDFTHALGYSYSEDPNFMYCAEDMTTEGSVNWWLPSCDLSGGSSGGPWAQPMDESQGDGPVRSVNSWGYTNLPGMAGPKLSGSSAQCVFGVATSTPFAVVATTDGDEGIATNCAN